MESEPATQLQVTGSILEQIVSYLSPNDIISLYLSEWIGELDNLQWKQILLLKTDPLRLYVLTQNYIEKCVNYHLQNGMLYTDIFRKELPTINYFALFQDSFKSQLKQVPISYDTINLLNLETTNFKFHIKTIRIYFSNRVH